LRIVDHGAQHQQRGDALVADEPARDLIGRIPNGVGNFGSAQKTVRLEHPENETRDHRVEGMVVCGPIVHGCPLLRVRQHFNQVLGGALQRSRLREDEKSTKAQSSDGSSPLNQLPKLL
jgi:hypothetical protein